MNGFSDCGVGCDGPGCTLFIYSFLACCISKAHFRFRIDVRLCLSAYEFVQTLHSHCGEGRQNHASLPIFRLLLWTFVCISLGLNNSAHGTMTSSTILLSRIELPPNKTKSKIRLYYVVSILNDKIIMPKRRSFVWLCVVMMSMMSTSAQTVHCEYRIEEHTFNEKVAIARDRI